MTIIAHFDISYIQYLNAQSQLLPGVPPLSNDREKLLSLYETMVLLRSFDTKAVSLQRTGKMGTYASTLGQEAISVAIGDVMHPEDVLCPDYRSYGAQIQRGVTLSEILTYWGGDERGNCFANNAKDFPISVPIGTQCLHAAGVATAIKYRHQPRAVVTICGDGGTSEGDFYEAINLAGVWKLPVVFVINNNQWAISHPRSAQTAAKTLAQKAIAGGFEGIQVDGNDIIALHSTLQDALDKARNGGGPTLVEAITYRLCDHTTADDATRYRSAEALKAAWELEPIKRLRNYLIQQNFWEPTQEEQLAKKCAQIVEAAVTDYLNLPPPSVSFMFDNLYATLPESLVAQREEALQEAKSTGVGSDV
jgi:2-oxoisovalerate dehydrogenase E1 component alpha subunit